MSNKLTTKEFAEKVGMTGGRINQLIKSGEIEAEKFGRDYVIDSKYLEIILSRPKKKSGRPKIGAKINGGVST